MVIETLKTIVSAWSVALIFLFLIVATAERPSDPSMASLRTWETLALFAMAVTGAGWLWARKEEKKKSRRTRILTYPNK